MKSFLIAFVLLATTTSFAGQAPSIIRGADAEAIIDALMATSESGTAEATQVETSMGSSQEGERGENVIDQWQMATGRVGDKKYECESHTYLRYKISKKNESTYQDFAACRIISPRPKGTVDSL